MDGSAEAQETAPGQAPAGTALEPRRKRVGRKKLGPKRGALANGKGLLAPLDNASPQDVIRRLVNDERSADIAQSLGVSRSALNQWLLVTCEDEWKAAQVARAITRKESAEEEIEGAADPLSLARAREKLKSAQWDLERICSRIFGLKPTQVTVNTVNVDAGLVGSIRELIDRKSQAEDAEIVEEQCSNSADPSSEV